MVTTTNYLITEIIEGQGQQAVTVNTALEIIDTALGGYLVKSIAGSIGVTLTTAEYRHRSIEYTGAITANIAVTVPNNKHLFVAYKNTTGAFTVTVKTAAGTGVAIPSGLRVILVNNGTDVYPIGSVVYMPATYGNVGEFLQTDGVGTTAWVSVKNVVPLTDAATVTPSLGTDGRPYLGVLATLSQATNFANPTGTLIDGQQLVIRVISTVARALTFGTKYKGSTVLPLPTTTTGSSLRDYWLFSYTTSTDTFDILAGVPGVG